MLFFASMPDKTNKVFVKPAEGLKVVNPNATQRFVDPKGESLEKTTGVLRSIRFGDLVEGKADKKTEPKPKKEKKAPKQPATNNEDDQS